MLFHVLGDFVWQADRETVFIQRAVIPGEVHHMNRGWFLQSAAILAILIVYVCDPVPIANVAVLSLGSFHCGVGLFLGQAVERGAGAVSKTGNQTPRCKKLDFVRKNAPFFANSLLELNFS